MNTTEVERIIERKLGEEFGVLKFHRIAGDLDAERVTGLPDPPIFPTAWVALTLATNWSTFAGFELPEYRKTGDLVEVRGSVTKSIAGVVGETITTLPTGFRPSTPVRRVVARATAGVAILDVLTNGNVIWQSGLANTQIMLDLQFWTS